MLQSFSGKKSRSFQPVQLNNTAQKYARDGTNFLAFNGLPLKPEVIEYQKADLSQYTAKSADVPLKINNLKDSPVLDNTFNKPGVFMFKYEDVANPVAYGDDYNMDFGGKDPTAIGYFQKPERQLAEYVKRDAKFTDRYNNLKPKQYGGPEKMGGVTMSNINPLIAYKTYGYRENDEWVKDEGYVGALASNLKRKEKSTLQLQNYKKPLFDLPKFEGHNEKATMVMDIDQNHCSGESVLVNGQCIPLNASARYCPEGYKFIQGVGCQRDDHVKPVYSVFTGQANDKLVPFNPKEKQDAVCPMGWEYKNGQCQVIKREFSTGEPEEDESACNYTLGIILGLVVVLGGGAILASAMRKDNKPRI